MSEAANKHFARKKSA